MIMAKIMSFYSWLYIMNVPRQSLLSFLVENALNPSRCGLNQIQTECALSGNVGRNLNKNAPVA